MVVGSAGTSFGGGLPGGSLSNYKSWSNQRGEDASEYGGRYKRNTYIDDSGLNRIEGRIDSGGLLIVYALSIIGEGNFLSNGQMSQFYDSRIKLYTTAGASGGGSVNVFAKDEINFNENSLSCLGGKAFESNTYGGNGTANAGTISTGIFSIKYSK